MLSKDKTRVQISLPKELIAKAEKQADKEIRTLSNLIEIALKQYLAADK